MQERCQALESEIQGLEQSIAECETALENFVSAEETMRVTEALAGSQKGAGVAGGGVVGAVGDAGNERVGRSNTVSTGEIFRNDC